MTRLLVAVWLSGCGGSTAVPAAPTGRATAPAPAGSARAHGRPPPSAATSAPENDAAPLPEEGSFGTAHPTVVEAVSPTGSWVSYCQARRDADGDGRVAVEVGPAGALTGDPLTRYLALSSGAERAVDDLLAASDDGRWLVTSEGGSTLLLDTRSGAVETLRAEARRDALSFREHRYLSFDGEGRQLLYVRDDGGTRSVVIRELASGREAVVKPGPGRLSRARLDFAGRWVLLEVVAEDTNGNGRLDLPLVDAPPGPRPCSGPIPTFVSPPERGDRPVSRAALARSGVARDVPGLVAAFERRLLVRLPDDEWVLQDARGHRQRFGPGTCRGPLLHADTAAEAALLACERTEGPDSGRNEVELWRAGARRRLGIFVTAQATDTRPGAPARLVALYPGRDAVLFDFDDGTTRPLASGDHVLATAGARALVLHGAELLLLDVSRGSPLPLATVPGDLPDLVRQPPAVVVGSVVVDVDRGVVLGRVDEHPLAVTRSGVVLVATGGAGDATRLAVGPLAWRRPRPDEPAPRRPTPD